MSKIIEAIKSMVVAKFSMIHLFITYKFTTIKDKIKDKFKK